MRRLDGEPRKDYKMMIDDMIIGYLTEHTTANIDYLRKQLNKQ